MRKLIGICVAAAILVSMLAFTPLASVAAEPTKLIDFYWEELYYDCLLYTSRPARRLRAAMIFSPI